MASPAERRQHSSSGEPKGGNEQPSDHAPVVVNLVWPPEDGEEEEGEEDA